MPRSLAALLLLVSGTQAIFFGGGSSCCCQPSCRPACPPPPPAPVCNPAPSCGCGGGGGYAAPVSYAPQAPIYAAPQSGYALSPRGKRDTEQAFDPKCNSEVLKNIIIKNIHENTAMAKRQIQTAAANEIGGRVDVICSKGTFSYIVNTELYCETAVDGTTCFAFRQSST